MIKALFEVLAPQGSRGRLTTLLFHKVPRTIDSLTPRELTLEHFEAILDFLQAHFRVLPLSEATKALESGTLPSRAVSITFDDGYADWLDGASSALLARGMPATFFITTEQLGGGPALWHERIVAAVRALPEHGALLPPGFGHFSALTSLRDRVRLIDGLQDQLKYVPLPERLLAIDALEAQAVTPIILPPAFPADSVRALHAKGFEIGGHTVRHPILNKCTVAEARDEIGGCREALEAIVRAPVTQFAYPNGRAGTDYRAEHVDLVRQCGYLSAVSTDWGCARSGGDSLQLPRFTPWAREPWRIAWQLARNIRETPQRHWMPSSELHVLSPERMPKARPLRALYVENGSGFGGAIVALETLLEAAPPADLEAHVLTNFPVGRFASLPAVRSVNVMSDRTHDVAALIAPLKRHPRAGLGWRRAALFVAGRADDLFNRVPYLLGLMREIRRIKPDLVHGNNGPFPNREAILASRIMRVPYVQHLRGEIGSGGGERWLFRQPAAYIPVSKWLGEELAGRGAPRERICQIYDAIPPAPPLGAPYFRKELGAPDEVALVALLGMLVPWKGQRLFIDAIARIPADFPARFLIIGGTPEQGDPAYARELEARIESLGQRDRIRLTGLRRDVPSLLPEIDVAVSASESPEPLGLIMLEGMRAGAVFVGPRHGAAIEVVRSRDDGFLFTPNDVASFALALQEAVVAAKAGREARDALASRIDRDFSNQRHAQRVLRLYCSQA